MKSNIFSLLQITSRSILGIFLLFIASKTNATINECGNDVNAQNMGSGFNGFYAPSNWTTQLNDGTGSVNVTGTSIVIQGNNNSEGGVFTTASTIAVSGGQFTFNWSWTTNDSPAFDPAFYINGSLVTLTNSSSNSQSGTVTITVAEGATIGFGINSTDGCCGFATLTITSFQWPGNCPLNECGNFVNAGGFGNGFTGYYAPGEWTTNLDGGNGSVSLPTPLSLQVLGNNNLISGSQTSFTSTAVVAGTISFNWSWTTADSPSFDPAFFTLNGIQTNLTNSSSNSQSGTFSLAVTAGSTFGFGVDATDGCCGRGTLTITNFTWPGNCLTGCTNPLACNYNSLATQDDGACILPSCFDPLACNFNAAAECDDNSLCVYPGCTDSNACNFDPSAGCTDNVICSYPGCNNPLACNYDEIAGCNDGSCILPPTNDICSNAMPWTNNFSNQTFSNANTCVDDPISCETPDGFNQIFFNDVWFSFVATGGSVDISTLVGGVSDCSPYIAVYDNCNGSLIKCSQPLFTESCFCFFSIGLTLPCGSLTQGSTYYVRVGGDIQNDLSPESNPNLNTGTFRMSFDQNFYAPGTLFGCTDPEACNFTPGAICGVCLYPGCNDPLACNYSPNAGCNDSSCIYSLCTDPTACNYIPDVCIEEPCEYTDCNGICGGLSAQNNCNECVEPSIIVEEITFNYSGQEESYVIPENTIKVDVELVGAAGQFATLLAGNGGRAKGQIYPNAGDVLFVNVGGTGISLGEGGYNGGGDGAWNNFGGAGGGGASDIRLISGDLSSRIIVAAGGGGGNIFELAYSATPGGSGGGLVGICASGNCSSAGTQIAGGTGNVQNGAFGIGGNGTTGNIRTAGGGGGWYGGGATFNSIGGGGSSYIGGVSNGFTQANVANPSGNGSVTLRVTRVYNTEFCFPGCTDPTAINYASAAIFDDGSCLYAGCMDPTAVNYNPAATFGDNTCIYILGCTYADALNYNTSAQQDDGTCQFNQSNTCPADLNNDGLVGITDLLIFVAAYGSVCP